MDVHTVVGVQNLMRVPCEMGDLSVVVGQGEVVWV